MNVSILGVSTTAFGELWEVSPRAMAHQVVDDTLAQSHLKKSDIDVVFVGNMLSGMLGGQENVGAFFTSELGMNCAAFKIEGACASGGLAVHAGVNAISSGSYRNALVIGIEKMTDYNPSEVANALMGAGSDEERKAGLTFPGLYALMARSYMKRYGASERDLAGVSVKNHFHATLNPNAQFQFPLTIEKVLKSSCVADPLKLFDCSPISDGCAALVLTNNEHAQKLHSQPIAVLGSAVATDTLSLADRFDLTTLKSACLASQKAYQQAGIVPSRIDVAEVHDCFTIAELIALEDLGFAPRGKSGALVQSGAFTLGTKEKGYPVVNTSGGLKACGHPVGATGVKQIVEIVTQLRGGAGKRQVEGAKIGLTHNVGGSGAVAVVHILSV